MIKSKIDARERALELVMPLVIELVKGGNTVDLTSMANQTVEYLIGDVELSEVVDDNDNIKTLIGMIETEMAAFRKQGNDNLDTLTNFLDKRGMALSGTPCKSETE